MNKNNLIKIAIICLASIFLISILGFIIGAIIKLLTIYLTK